VHIDTGERIADAVSQNLQSFGVNRGKLNCFVLVNAYNNDIAVNKLAAMYDFVAAKRRLCVPSRVGCLPRQLSGNPGIAAENRGGNRV
jgi:hypothetical protein